MDGSWTFGPPKIIDNNADNVNDAIAVNIDGDGDFDIVAAIDQQSSAVWYENEDGLGNLFPRKVISSTLLACLQVGLCCRYRQ